MSTHQPHTRPVSPWKPSTVGRLPVPTPAVVTARPLLDALHAALDGPAPCASSPDLFTSGDEADSLVAAEHCASCPARAACLAYGAAIAATCGTWGGVDRTPRDARRSTTTDERASA